MMPRLHSVNAFQGSFDVGHFQINTGYVTDRCKSSLCVNKVLLGKQNNTYNSISSSSVWANISWIFKMIYRYSLKL